jgi:thioester reductase-like protein
MKNLVDCLEHWAHAQPDKTLYTFLDSRGHIQDQYTYQQFFERGSGLAQQLADRDALAYGDRVLLVYPPGLEMLTAFFAVLNLGAIPVPVCAPHSLVSGADAERIEHVAQDCGASLALTTEVYLGKISDTIERHKTNGSTKSYLRSVSWLATDSLESEGLQFRRRKTNDILFLQYTSGSTGDPKGVIVTHKNVLHNASETLRHCPVGVSWLPQHHDMGLIGHYLFALIKGGTNHGFAPFTFLKQPTLWFHTITKVQATLTTAPNFAYSYCLREDKVPDSALVDVDLSSLRGVLNAAEPINPETYERFYTRFSRYGLAREAHYGGYGLAESTLAVSLHGRQSLIVQKQRLQQRKLSIQKTHSRNNNQITLVSCGQPFSSLDVRIVDPDSSMTLGEDTIGEIWVDGESKCAGYWQRPELSQAHFAARVKEEPDNPRRYLRTGDLGFLHEGELYVCGRLKDMIIIHGSNYYPQDIEAIVDSWLPNETVRNGGRCAAFAVDSDGQEQLAVVAEVRPKKDSVDPAALAQVIRSRYFIDPYQVFLVPPRTISKTTSGKVSRSKTRDLLLCGELPVVSSYTRKNGSCQKVAGLKGIHNRILELYDLSGKEEITLTEIGLDSLTLVELTLEIQLYFEGRGLAHLVSELDTRFLQRISVAEITRILESYESGPDVPADGLRVWLRTRQQADDSQERKMMHADAHWHAPADSAAEAVDDPQSILMTGGSGFFGPFLLRSLLQRTKCSIEVLTRATDPGHGNARIIDALRRAEIWTPEIEAEFEARVRVLCGELGCHQLGLGNDQWQRLSEETDAIVHNGAQVNYVLSYDALRAVNVEATRELMRLAATKKKKPFHLISSTFIHGWSDRPIAAEHEYNEQLEDLDFGYAQSKCVAEHVVRNAERHGQPIRIYRPTLISASSHGIGSTNDIGVRLLAFMIKYGIGVEALNQTSFLPVDLVSDHIARIFNLKDTESSTLHVTTTQYYNMMDVTRNITEQFGYSFKYLSLPRFIEEMNRLCTPEDLLYPLLVFFNRSYDKLKPMESKRYDNRYYRAALKCVGPDVMETDPSDTVAYMVKHLQRDGLIPVASLT